jgi:hypothetical protein
MNNDLSMLSDLVSAIRLLRLVVVEREEHGVDTSNLRARLHRLCGVASDMGLNAVAVADLLDLDGLVSDHSSCRLCLFSATWEPAWVALDKQTETL